MDPSSEPENDLLCEEDPSREQNRLEGEWNSRGIGRRGEKVGVKVQFEVLGGECEGGQPNIVDILCVGEGYKGQDGGRLAQLALAAVEDD